MTTRTKIFLCFGLLVLAAGVGLREKLPVTGSFVSYSPDGERAVVLITNHTQSAMRGFHGYDADFGLVPGEGVQFSLAVIGNAPPRAGFHVNRQPSIVGRIMARVGLPVDHSYLVILDLPPRPAATSLGPTNQPAL